jgi:hypothetical protein
MKTDEYYHKWLTRHRAMNIPEGWADSVMQGIDRYEASRPVPPMRVQAWLEWLCHCMPARVALVLAGSVVCVVRFVVLFLAVLG